MVRPEQVCLALMVLLKSILKKFDYRSRSRSLVQIQIQILLTALLQQEEEEEEEPCFLL